ncbi:hypothetical protein O1611_g6548 [Lasiodiplodia mahajangana]|uniref:Uncharacterized protein n=1 Tax=Lasiodiplodia mahajangana TaxID=1108764 RepID=A0ACC2JIS6_9PEZI|nr:hypothetical protein O1611_g6548 [Lasiodiplodia mahajangana]
MRFSEQDINNDLLAMGGWADDKAPNQSSTTRPQQRHSERHHVGTQIEPHHQGYRPQRVGYARRNGQNHRSQPSRSEDGLLERPPRDAIKEVRAAQLIRRLHPAFPEAEGGQRGNEATAKPSASLSKVEQRFRKHASSAAYLLLDGHDGIEPSNPVQDEENVF